MNKRRYAIILFFIILAISVYSQQQYYPESSWQTKMPADVNMNPRKLDSAVKFANKNEVKIDRDLRNAILKAFSNEPSFEILGPVQQRGKPAGIILRHGYIVAKWGDVNRVDMTFSVTKSYLSTIAGLALDARKIRNIDDKVKEYVPGDKFEGAHNSKITWRHLLNQTSDWSGCLYDVCDWADRPPSTGNIDDWKNRKLIEPGEQFEYNDVRVNLLAYSLLQVLRKPLPVVLKEKIMDPINASSTWRWHGYENSFENIDGVKMQSVSGGGHFGGGLFINALDQARFGLLFLRKGKWKNRQLISQQWVDSLHLGQQPNRSYGFMWWTNQENTFRGISPDIYYAAGFGGNYIVIDNENDLVVVARWLDPDKMGDLLKLVTDSIEK